MRFLILYVLIIFFSDPVTASVKLKLILSENSVTVGETLDAKVIIPDVGNVSQLPNLGGLVFDDTLYLIDMGPIVTSGNESSSDVVVIFSKPFEKNILEAKVNNYAVALELPQGLSVNQDKVSEEFIILDSGYSYRSFNYTYLYYLLVLVILVAVLVYFKRKKKRVQPKAKLDIKSMMLSAVEYEDIVQVWYKREDIKTHFPAFYEDYKEFENTLNKHQFSPVITEEDKEKIVTSYQSFLMKIKGGLDGV